MSKEQIEEMAKDLCQNGGVCCLQEWNDCHLDIGKYCHKCNTVAERLYNAGYHKIQTTNWLTKGISEEQLEREKEEALKEFFERNCEKYGYRKQIKAEWIICSDGYYPYCSNCKNEPKNGVMTDYCPSCGAHMKGENE